MKLYDAIKPMLRPIAIGINRRVKIHMTDGTIYPTQHQQLLLKSYRFHPGICTVIKDWDNTDREEYFAIIEALVAEWWSRSRND